MQPKKIQESPDMFRSRLDQILNKRHPLFVLSHQIDWSYFEKNYGPTYVESEGRPGNPIRLMVGLHYLKHAYDESDESVLARFIENAYWQYFCGFEYFQHHLPIDSSSLTRFRQRIGVSGAEVLFGVIHRYSLSEYKLKIYSYEEMLKEVSSGSSCSAGEVVLKTLEQFIFNSPEQWYQWGKFSALVDESYSHSGINRQVNAPLMGYAAGKSI